MVKIAVALLENMRPKQWAKNGFVFAGILFDKKFDDADSMLRVILAFILLCLTSSTIYLINDIVDIEKDRQHPKKKNRPLASGRLPVNVARMAAIIFPITAIGIALLYSPPLAAVLVSYLVLHIAYSFILKNIVLLDIFAIAAGFVLRVIAGVVVIHVQQFSPWLYVCAGLLSLFMAIGKRRQELILLGENGVAESVRTTYKDYNMPLLDDMLQMVLACTALAYSMYAVEAKTILLVNQEYMLLTVPVVFYGLLRYLYLIHRKNMGGDPTEILFLDRPLQMTLVVWVAMLFAMLYIM